MKNPTLDKRNTLPVLLFSAAILALLVCIAQLGYGQETWTLQNWDLPYAGCSNWCS